MVDALDAALAVALALIPAGKPALASAALDTLALVGLSMVDALGEPCPEGMALVDGGYCPSFGYRCRSGGGAESRCAEYARDGACPGAVEPRRFCVDRFEWPNLAGENPKVYVSWFEAKDLCRSVGKRLCARSEWTLACEGPKRLPYPYGYLRQPSPCNIDRSPVAFDIESILDPATRDAEISRLWQADAIGSHPACASAWGAFDLVGNVDEWTDNQADEPGTREPSTLNGGYWGPVRDTCRLTTRSHGPDFRFYQVGFRCCADAVDGIPKAAPPGRREPTP